MHQRQTIDRSVRNARLEELADTSGMIVDEMLESAASDSVTPAICTNGGCDLTTEYEPDQYAGWREECDANTVASALILAEVI